MQLYINNKINHTEIKIPVENFYLEGILNIPENINKKIKNIVLFVHGSGSSRFSPRNQYVADILNQANIATLLFDLLTPQEETIDKFTREYRFNIELLTARLISVTDWMLQHSAIKNLSIGYFGASTGGGVALKAAAIKSDMIKAVVSRGGRPDLAGEALSQVKAATLLIVGEQDQSVIEINKNAINKINNIKNNHKKLAIIPGATHLFEEPGTLQEVAHLATQWFIDYLK